MYRLRAKRTTGSNPPAELLFGELAFSDTNKRLYVGRADGSPCTFESDLSLSSLTDAIAALVTSDDAQDTAIANLTNDLATLDTSQAAQGQTIALLNTASNSQADAIGQLSSTASTLNGALVSLEANIQTALSTKLEAPAIASFETTAQLNDRDTANRSRANHTGTQPANTVTGLAAVATSGAYGDLTGRPPAGFTYDQQTEPLNPAAGETWRERSSGGLIIGEWQLDNEALRWVEIVTRSQSFMAAGTGSNFGLVPIQSGILDPLGTILYLGFKGNFWINTTANASNYYEQRLMTYQKEPATDSIVGGNSFSLLTPYSAAITVPNTNVPYSVSTKQLISRPGGLIGFRSWVNPVGTPGSFRSIGSVLFKNVRAA